MQKYLYTILGFAALHFLVSCSSMNSPLKKLEGKWTAGGAIDDYHSWYLEYKIKGKNYQLTGYPPLSETGTIKLKDTKGDSMLVEFIVKKSSPTYQNHEEWIYLKDDSFTMEGRIFTRSNPSAEK